MSGLAERTALVVGATGLVGSELLKLLLADSDYRSVRTFVRRPSGMVHPKLRETVIDFDALPAVQEMYAADDYFCCLGTTASVTKDLGMYHRIDVDYPVAFARRAKAAGAKQCVIVSAIHANRKSRAWYLRLKGEAEEELHAIGFASLQLIRPSLIYGERTASRLNERMGVAVAGQLSSLMPWWFGRYQPVSGELLAKAIWLIAKSGRTGRAVWEPPALIERIASHHSLKR